MQAKTSRDFYTLNSSIERPVESNMQNLAISDLESNSKTIREKSNF